MKIAIIVRKLNVRGGTQRLALMLARELALRGHSVTLYTFAFDRANCFPELLEGRGVISLSSAPQYQRRGFFLINPFFSVLGFIHENRAAKKLSQLIDADTDILNPHDQVSYRVAAYFKKRKPYVPSVWTMNDLPTKAFSFLREKEIHPLLRMDAAKALMVRLLDWYDYMRFIRIQDRIIVLDNRDKEWVKIFFNKDAEVIRIGIDSSAFSYIPREHMIGKKVRLLMNGIFFPHRRFEDGIEALKILMDKGFDVSLTIIGDFTNKKYTEDVRDIIVRSGLEMYVRLLGKVSEETLRNAYREHDIFLFPNHLQSWGIAVFEAMASGCPVIVSKTAGASEVLTDGVHALLVNPKSPEEIADAVKRLVDDVELYQKLSKNGRLFVEHNLTWERYTDDMMKVFADVMRK